MVVAVDEAPNQSDSFQIQRADAGMLLAAEVQDNIRRARRFGFHICGTGFLVPAGLSSEVVHRPRIHSLPWEMDFVRGMLNLRGNIIPVLDLAPLFEKTRDSSGSCDYALVLDSGHKAVALVADALPSPLICEPDEPAVTDGLPIRLRDFLRASGMAAGERWFELDHVSCLSALLSKRSL